MFAQFKKNRNIKKNASQCISRAVHFIHLREDLLDADVLRSIQLAAEALNKNIKLRNYSEMDKQVRFLTQLLDVHQEPRSWRRGGGSFGENFEVLVVAIVAAMGLRAYVLQPFKIPTGSMQPTLYGITSETMESRSWLDRYPFNIFHFALTGTWFSERTAQVSGYLGEPSLHPTDPSSIVFWISGREHKLPREVVVDQHGQLNPLFRADRFVNKGDVLWTGRTHRGDHLFVNKILWNFRQPRRDEVMVFRTDNIPTLEEGTHYIKRLVGLPGEHVTINAPYLIINHSPVAGFHGIDRITHERDKGYAGFKIPEHLESAKTRWTLSQGEYFALGDNTSNSRDSRYWGPVPEENLVGPAAFVYWPFSRRWGLVR